MILLYLSFCCLCRSVYDDLVVRGVIQPSEEMPPPTVPMDYSWARVSVPLNSRSIDQGFCFQMKAEVKHITLF